MASIDFIKNNLDQLIADTKVQLESIQNDIKVLPETIQQIAANSQVLMSEARTKLESVADGFINGDLLKKDYKPEIQKVVVELQTSVTKILDSIKKAIEKAK